MTQAQLAQGNDPLLAVRDVSVVFGGIIALNGVSFDMRHGQILGRTAPARRRCSIACRGSISRRPATS
jgi:branched-chain amino acid transport system ATP-binding protein